MNWQLALQLGSSDQPLFQRIAIAIATDIERGRLRVGTRLASSRTLARQLGINRNTVVAAYDELCAQGWIAIEPTRGAFVTNKPIAKSGLAGADGSSTLGYPERPGFDLPADALDEDVTPGRPPGSLILLGGVPELRGAPRLPLARAYRAALCGNGARRLLDYASPQGHIKLRTALANLMSHVRGVAAPLSAITVVRGSQQGLYLAARALLRPGDRVAVEHLGFRPAWRALELGGATLVPISVDRDGLDLDVLEAAHATHPIRAVYTTPHHQYPSTVTLSAERRTRLLAFARRHRIMILEDDYDFDYHYEGNPVLPLAASDRTGVVIYFGTLSKTLAPGLRIGYVVAPPVVAQQLVAYRRFVDTQGDAVLEHAIATLLEDGEVQRHTRRALGMYRRRRDALCEALHQRLPQLVAPPPNGGMAVWASAPGIDSDAWVKRGAAAGVLFQAGSRFRFDGQPFHHLRLGFAACNEVELVEAVDRMTKALSPK
ncbi:MAG TPA: PLP-dependent aminotransferase family protein [Kofleriaceae bacterium]